jgi:DUF971 family protein
MTTPPAIQVKPAGIVVDLEQRLLQINWDDGHTSIYDFDTLRRACPCAECRPWIHDLVKQQTPHEIPESTRTARGELATLRDIQPVGSYALFFNWADGHTYGIYDWKYLRALDDGAHSSHDTVPPTPKDSD